MYVFCLGGGAGADKVSFYFQLLRIYTHVGISASALQKLINQIEVLLIQFQVACEKSLTPEKRRIVAAMDESFFGQWMILVLMDLNSGYLLLEDISDDRCFETWYAKTKPRLESLRIEVNYAVSDSAKALIKLALTGFECASGADTFHAQQDISRWLGNQLGKREKHAQTALNDAQQKEQQAPASLPDSEMSALQAHTRIAEQVLVASQQIQGDYHDNLQGIADAVHPLNDRMSLSSMF